MWNFNLASRSVLVRSMNFCMLVVFVLFACPAKKTIAQEKFNNLGLVAYNYTDQHISDYSVNNAGGGNVPKYSKYSGGGGITCCFNFASHSLNPIMVKVRWQHGGCIYILKNDWTNEAAEVTHYYYKEKEVPAVRMGANDPRFIETHFHANGSVQVQITDSVLGPKFDGKNNSKDKKPFPRCKNDRKPQ